MAFIIIFLQVTIKCHIWRRVLKNIPQNILFNLLCPQQWKILPTVFPNVNIQYMNTAGEMDHNNGRERRHTSVFKITTTWLAILPFVNYGIIAVHYVYTRPTSHQTPTQIFKTPQVMHLPTLYYVYTRPTSHQTPIQILKFHKSCICQLCNCALCIHKAHFLPDANANF
jgi:hypothetical protein